MKTIDMTNYDVVKTKATSSKGNQMKWLLDNFWYKQDHMGYEGLSEVVVSKLLKKSNVKGFIEYEPIKIKYNLANKSGCLSENFKGKDEIIVTLERMYKQYKGKSLASDLAAISETEDKIKRLESFKPKSTDHLKQFLNTGWHSIYENLTRENKRTFWRNVLDSVHVSPDSIEVFFK